MIDYITSPFRWFFKLESSSGLILLFAAVIALYLSNSNYSEFYFQTLKTHIAIGTENFNLDLSLNSINFTKLCNYFIALDKKSQKNLFKIKGAV